MATYRIFPAASGPGSAASDTATYTLGMEFTVSQACFLVAVWFWTATGATALPIAAAVYTETGGGASGTVTEQNTSPSWSAAAGSGQWVFCAMSGTTQLNPGSTYKTVILKDATALVYSATANYWSSGAGSAGLSNGPLTAPSGFTAAGGGQDTFVTPSGTLAYPATSFNSANYWVDVEVQPLSAQAGAAAPQRGGAVWRRRFARLQELGQPLIQRAPPPPPFTAASDAVPGRARPGFMTPGNPLAPTATVPAAAASPVTRMAGGTAQVRETYRSTQ